MGSLFRALLGTLTNYKKDPYVKGPLTRPILTVAQIITQAATRREPCSHHHQTNISSTMVARHCWDHLGLAYVQGPGICRVQAEGQHAARSLVITVVMAVRSTVRSIVELHKAKLSTNTFQQNPNDD